VIKFVNLHPVGDTGDTNILERFRDCYGVLSNWLAAYASSWSIQYPQVTSAYTVQQGLGRATGISGGLSNIDGLWTDERYQPRPEGTCDMIDVAADAQGNVTARAPQDLRSVPPDQYTYTRPGD
jgi:hypothetical protein